MVWIITIKLIIFNFNDLFAHSEVLLLNTNYSFVRSKVIQSVT